MSNGSRAVVGVACLLGIFIAYFGSRSTQPVTSRDSASNVAAPGPRSGSTGNGRWLLQFQRRTESRIVALWAEVRNPTDQAILLARGNRRELEPAPEVVQRRRAEGTRGPHAFGVERQLKGTTEWEEIQGGWVPEKKQPGDDRTAFAPVARLDPGETRGFLLILGTMLEREGDSGYRWRLRLYDAAGGQLDQIDLSP